MKKKPPAAAAPAKTLAPPTKQAAPPQGDTTPTPAAAPADKGKDFSDTPVAAAADSAGDAIKPFKVDPAFLPPRVPGFGSGSDQQRFKFSFDPPSLIDWAAMRQPFLTRGAPLGPVDTKMIEQNWVFSYNSMVQLGLSPEIAAKVANIGTPLAYDFSLARDYPTAAEIGDKEVEKMMGAGKKLGTFTVPIITPDTLGWAVKKVFGKDIDFHF
jgi:hypothetical protein